MEKDREIMRLKKKLNEYSDAYKKLVSEKETEKQKLLTKYGKLKEIHHETMNVFYYIFNENSFI